MEHRTHALTGRRVLLGVTGGIACYKSVTVARLLTQAGAAVDVVLTRGAQEFIGGPTFEGVTGRRVHTDLFEPGEALAHIRLAGAADLVVVAPTTADFLARLAHGRADDLLSASLLATRAPVLLVPAMNDRMWAHAATRANAERAATLGYSVMEPAVGPLAFGEGEGPGRMPEPDEIVARAAALIERQGTLSGRRIVVTAGATREPIDPVRFISNHSSGRMGVAIARAAELRGAAVTLIAGAMEVAPPERVAVVRVGTTAEMGSAVEASLPGASALIMAAAPADFRAADVAARKMKKSSAPASIALATTDDILIRTRAARPAGSIAVGFALESEDLVENARQKLATKGLDLVVANRAGVAGEGFGGETNRVTLVSATDAEELPLMSKAAVAERILDRLEELLDGR